MYARRRRLFELNASHTQFPVGFFLIFCPKPKENTLTHERHATAHLLVRAVQTLANIACRIRRRNAPCAIDFSI